eukprot:768177-Hanusia_phi.AAC.17
MEGSVSNSVPSAVGFGLCMALHPILVQLLPLPTSKPKHEGEAKGLSAERFLSLLLQSSGVTLRDHQHGKPSLAIDAARQQGSRSTDPRHGLLGRRAGSHPRPVGHARLAGRAADFSRIPPPPHWHRSSHDSGRGEAAHQRRRFPLVAEEGGGEGGGSPTFSSALQRPAPHSREVCAARIPGRREFGAHGRHGATRVLVEYHHVQQEQTNAAPAPAPASAPASAPAPAPAPAPLSVSLHALANAVY